MTSFNSTVTDIQTSGIRQFFNLASNYPDAIGLTLGQPDFPTPERIKQAGIAAILQNETVYTPNAGTMRLRQCASEYYSKHGNLYDAQTEIIVTMGASGALDITLRGLLNPGDEVIIPAPVYPGYEPLIRMMGATPIFVDTTESGFKLTPEQIQSARTKRTRAVIVPYPSNPTGVVLTHAESTALANYFETTDLWIISDEIYSDLVYDVEFTSFSSFPNIRQQTVVIQGLSKSHSMTGWRVGFVLAPANVCAELVKVQQYSVSCASSVSQAAAIEALTGPQGELQEMKQTYAQRRNYLLHELARLKLPVTKPEGAFYVFPSIASFGIDSWSFAARLLEEEQLAVIPGRAFAPYGDAFIRLSYAYSDASLQSAVARLERFISRI
ncbi:MAG: aminotransferase class I/II-fold pyridoxal phosphate-dependent enzyme [Bacilli bacterium]